MLVCFEFFNFPHVFEHMMTNEKLAKVGVDKMIKIIFFEQMTMYKNLSRLLKINMENKYDVIFRNNSQ